MSEPINDEPLSRRGAIKLMGAIATTAAAAGAATGESALADTNTDLTWLPAWRLQQMIASREISSLQVTEHFLARIERLQPRIHAFRQYDAQQAREQARAADQHIAAGRPPGLLHGVPIGVKDHIAIRGYPVGTAPTPAEHDSVIVERLRNAGAVIVGNLVMPGMGAPAGQSLENHPRNPWDQSRVPGSSSAGPAASVAAGMLPVAIGSDGGGSTRLPASFCGLVGVHPTQGRIPAYNYGDHTFSFLGTLGPIARDARDAALIMKAVAGPDGRAMISSILDAPPDYLSGLNAGANGLRIVWMEHLGYGAEFAVSETPQVVATAHQAAVNLRTLGATVTERPGNWSDPRPYSTVLNSLNGVQTPAPPTPEQIQEAFDKREEYRAGFATLFREFDVLVLPTALFVAPELEQWSTMMNTGGMQGLINATRRYTANTLMFNFLQMPAISVPCGFVNGMPVGLQLVGMQDSDPRLLSLAHAYLERFPQTRRPRLA